MLKKILGRLFIIYWFIIVFYLIFIALPFSTTCFGCSTILSPLVFTSHFWMIALGDILNWPFGFLGDLVMFLILGSALSLNIFVIKSLITFFLALGFYRFCKRKGIKLWYVIITPSILIVLFILNAFVYIPYINYKAKTTGDVSYCEKILVYPKTDLFSTSTPSISLVKRDCIWAARD